MHEFTATDAGVGYLVAQYPAGYLLQRYPVGKFIGITTFCELPMWKPNARVTCVCRTDNTSSLGSPPDNHAGML